MNALMIAHVASMIDHFNMPNIKLLIGIGYSVHVACNFKSGSSCDDAEIESLKAKLDSLGVTYTHIDFERSPFSLKNLTAYKQLKNVFNENHYDLVHCHTPVGGVLGRLAAKKYRKTGTKVIYTAHGFHFFKGAPLKNWLLYYPVEWLCAFWTDELITINKEDYARAQKHMHAKHVTYIPGVGVDLKKFSPNIYTEEEIANARAELGVDIDEKMLLSVGELIPRKNHESVIRAITKVNNPKIKYFICGTGELKEYLERLIEELGLTDNVKLLGYRTDISKLCDCADLFVFPSLQEGLPVALMEAIASKTSVICSDIRGNTDLVGGDALFEPKNVNMIADKICEYLKQDNTEEVEKNYAALKKFDLEKVSGDVKAVYSEQPKKFDRGGVTYLERVFNLQQIQSDLSLSNDKFILLSVGELQSRKNHIVVINALSELKNPDIVYLIAGVGELHDKYQEIIDKNGMSDNIKLLGYRTDISELCEIADCFVHPSVREGLGIAPLEAMACGLPLISADINGIKDYTEDGVTGCCVNPHSVEEMKKAILKMYKDKAFRYECGKNNVQAVKAFGIENTSAIMKRVYKGISENAKNK